MSRGFDSRPPKNYVRLLDQRSAADEPALSPSLGAVLRVLAASRPGGVFLCAGDGAGESGAWVLDGMDLGARLVVVIEDADEADAVRAALGDDLRVTVHVQEAAGFFVDVRDHRFDLIVDLGHEPAAALAGLELRRLATGAFLMSRHSDAVLAQMLNEPGAAGEQAPALDAGDFALACLPGEPGVTLIARRAPRPEARRRGGRRAREGVTPLFSSKSRDGSA